MIVPRPRSSEESRDRQPDVHKPAANEPHWISLTAQRDTLQRMVAYFKSFGPDYNPMNSAAAYYEARASYALGVGWIDQPNLPISTEQDRRFRDYLDVQTERKYDLPAEVAQLTAQIEEAADRAGALIVDAASA